MKIALYIALGIFAILFGADGGFFRAYLGFAAVWALFKFLDTLLDKPQQNRIHQTKQAVLQEYNTLETAYAQRQVIGEGFCKVSLEGNWRLLRESDGKLYPTHYEEIGTFFLGWLPVKQKGKWGLLGTSGAITVPCIYDHIHTPKKELIAVTKDGKLGWLDGKGNVLIPCRYTKILPFPTRQGYFHIWNQGKEGLYHRERGELFPCRYDKIEASSEDRWWLCENGKYGLVREDGNVLIPFRWDQYSPGPDGKYFLREDAHWYLVDESGQESGYTAIEEFRTVSGGALVKQNGKWGSVDPEGRLVLPCQWKKVLLLAEKRYGVFDGEKWGIATEGGHLLSPCQWDQVTAGWRADSDTPIRVRQNDRYGFVDKNGRLITPCRWTAATTDFRSGRTKVWMGSVKATLDLNGEFVWERNRFVEQSNFRSGYAWTEMGEKWYQVWEDASLAEQGWDDVRHCGAFSTVCRSGNWGMVDASGTLVIPCVFQGFTYYNLENRQETLSALRGDEWVIIGWDGRILDRPETGPCWGHARRVRDPETGLYGFCIDPDHPGGRPHWLSHCKWEDACNNNEGMAGVCRDGRWGFISWAGHLEIPCQWDWVMRFQEGYAGVEQAGKWGFIDKTGRLAIPCIFDRVKSFRNGKARVCLQNHWGTADKQGNVAWDHSGYPPQLNHPDYTEKNWYWERKTREG